MIARVDPVVVIGGPIETVTFEAPAVLVRIWFLGMLAYLAYMTLINVVAFRSGNARVNAATALQRHAMLGAWACGVVGAALLWPLALLFNLTAAIGRLLGHAEATASIGDTELEPVEPLGPCSECAAPAKWWMDLCRCDTHKLPGMERLDLEEPHP